MEERYGIDNLGNILDFEDSVERYNVPLDEIVVRLNKYDKTQKKLERDNKKLKNKIEKLTNLVSAAVLQKAFDKERIKDLQSILKVTTEVKRELQNQLKLKLDAISELELVLKNFKNRPTYFDTARQELCLSDQDKQFIDYINNRIKELKEKK